MAKRTGWAKIRHAYICGEMSYSELAQKFGVSKKTISEVAKREEWVKKRRQFRDDVNTRAYTRAREAEVDELERIRSAADKLSAKLDEITNDDEQLFLHTAVLADMDGATDIYERKMKAFDPMKLTALTKAMKDMTAVLRDLHGLATRGEERAEKLAREKLNLEKKKFEFEKEKAGAGEGDDRIKFEIEPELAEGPQDETDTDQTAE